MWRSSGYSRPHLPLKVQVLHQTYLWLVGDRRSSLVYAPVAALLWPGRKASRWTPSVFVWGPMVFLRANGKNTLKNQLFPNIKWLAHTHSCLFLSLSSSNWKQDASQTCKYPRWLDGIILNSYKTLCVFSRNDLCLNTKRANETKMANRPWVGQNTWHFQEPG